MKDSDVAALMEAAVTRRLENAKNAKNKGEARGGLAVMDLIVPQGKLGVVLATPEPPSPPGLPYVFSVREGSPLVDKARLGDEIIAVDGEDVSKMTAIEVMKLLKRGSARPRRITVQRVGPAGERGDEAAGRAVAPSTPARKSDPVGEEVRVDLAAPRGRLGLVLATPEPPAPPGPPRIFSVREDSPLAGRARPRDKIVAVDGEDVSGMTAIEVMKLLKRGSARPRRITVLQEAPLSPRSALAFPAPSDRDVTGASTNIFVEVLRHESRADIEADVEVIDFRFERDCVVRVDETHQQFLI